MKFWFLWIKQLWNHFLYRFVTARPSTLVTLNTLKACERGVMLHPHVTDRCEHLLRSDDELSDSGSPLLQQDVEVQLSGCPNQNLERWPSPSWDHGGPARVSDKLQSYMSEFNGVSEQKTGKTEQGGWQLPQRKRWQSFSSFCRVLLSGSPERTAEGGAEELCSPSETSLLLCNAVSWRGLDFKSPQSTISEQIYHCHFILMFFIVDI